MSSRDAFLSQDCLRTRRPEPMVNPEAKPVRKCERCGCKLASDTKPYRGRLLCSPCQRPIRHVAECVSETNRERILMLCSGMSHADVAAKLGIGETAAAQTMNHVAKQIDLRTPQLRAVIEWALTHGLVPRPEGHGKYKRKSPQTREQNAKLAPEQKPSELLRTEQRATARAYKEIVESIAALAAAVPGLGDLIIGATQVAHKHGYQQGQIEALELLSR